MRRDLVRLWIIKGVDDYFMSSFPTYMIRDYGGQSSLEASAAPDGRKLSEQASEIRRDRHAGAETLQMSVCELM